MSEQRTTVGALSIADSFHDFVVEQAIPGTGVDPAEFWSSLEAIVADLAPKGRALLARRDELQNRIDDWHRAHFGVDHDAAAYREFLVEIGYIEAAPAPFAISTERVDREIASISGPQLVVPLDNARYSLNAANARWGSLYDALYGTDVIPESEGAEKGTGYNPVRGDRVIAFGRQFLDQSAPLAQGSHTDATGYAVIDGRLVVSLANDSNSGLVDPAGFVGYSGPADQPTAIVVSHHGLHIEIRIDPASPIGSTDSAGVSDIHIESAITAIMDLEDSVSAVDTADKIHVYSNWLGLMKGTLSATFDKGGQTLDRVLVGDRRYVSPSGASIAVPGRSLMLVRNVGLHLDVDAVLIDGEPIPETILDAMVTSLAAMHDLQGNGTFRNSREGSIYIVKPKMHGPAEVALASELFARVEAALGLESNTLKVGIMDEERRTSLNLAACIEAARERVVFINTGFLDRTGDEIHTDMEAGPVVPKPEMKTATWLSCYEDSNVDNGIRCGLIGRAQIGKGMWAKPEEMAEMVATKGAHPRAGASTAWVPSPTAATLHALHYHQADVASAQNDLLSRAESSDYIDGLLTLPIVAPGRTLTETEIDDDLTNACQGILGYVSRWVGQGVGCSTVPNIDNVGLMEDCATLRIASQHLANWLHHGIIDESKLVSTMARMAAVVDQQNAGQPGYRVMLPDLESSIQYQAALDLVLKGREQPNGYTEFVLYAMRLAAKSL